MKRDPDNQIMQSYFDNMILLSHYHKYIEYSSSQIFQLHSEIPFQLPFWSVYNLFWISLQGQRAFALSTGSSSRRCYQQQHFEPWQVSTTDEVFVL